MGEVNRACVAEAAYWAGEPGSGGGGIAVEQVEGGLINFGQAQQLFGLSAVEGSGLPAAGEGSLRDGEVFGEVLLREPREIEELAYGVPTQAGLDGLHERGSLHAFQAERFADACCRHVGRCRDERGNGFGIRNRHAHSVLRNERWPVLASLRS